MTSDVSGKTTVFNATVTVAIGITLAFTGIFEGAWIIYQRRQLRANRSKILKLQATIDDLKEEDSRHGEKKGSR